MSGRTLLADRLRDELLEEITSSQLQPGAKLPTRGRTRQALRRVSCDGARSGAGARRGRLCHPSPRFGQLCHRTPADAARTRLDAELPRDDRERGRACRDARPATRCSSNARRIDSPLQLSPRRHGPGGRARADGRRSAGDLLPRPHPRAAAPHDLDLQNLDPSLFALLSSSGHAADHATATLRAVASTSQTAKVLGIRRGKPLLYIEEIDYDIDGTPVMLSREWHVSEAFDVRINRQAHADADLHGCARRPRVRRT